MPLHLSYIPPGDAGNRITADAMRALARGASTHPLARSLASTITTGLPTARERAQMLRHWLAEHFVFLADPYGPGVFGTDEDIELLRDPVLMLQRVQQQYVARGDCDDVAMLAATLALATVPPLPTRYRLVAFADHESYSHVFTEVLTEPGWMELDVTRRGVHLPPVVRSEVVYV